MNLPAAVLLDLDGTLVDSEPLWSTAAADHARLHGCSWSAVDAAGIAGLPAPAVAALLHQRGCRSPPSASPSCCTRRSASGSRSSCRGAPGRSTC
ncbi:hypothetical protein [Cellulomonas cellasea]|uniref:Hydrolase n=1 Tax=Cellulomonas cellasea DSM 20118 TaxID=1408250 RepID=A0A0A0BBR5_9CELL|nr:hypothetical protein [Cellulomonas cellasea]KGM03329.1 hypothetical protein Q760_05640 [Cellulomonas cellasea DSM 20118]